MFFLLFIAYSFNLNAAPHYSKLVVFGDSLSDTGNHYGAWLLGELPHPYYQNRISNGPVSVDVLAGELGLSAATSGGFYGSGSGQNYAVSGAKARGDTFYDLNAQIAKFLAAQSHPIDDEALYVMMVGGNDVRGAALLYSQTAAINDARAAADAANEALERVLNAGAKSILVVNVPDVSKTPETAKRELNRPGITAHTAIISRAFNARLALNVVRLEKTYQVDIAQFDAFTRLNQMIAQPNAYGFSNVNEACYHPKQFSYHAQCDFNRFVFFDSIHPTAKVHQVFGLEMAALANNIQAIQQNSFLPAVIQLLLGSD